MEFHEVKELDIYDAFMDFITVSEAKNKGLIPDRQAVFFKDHCSCGSENIIKRSLTETMCCNPKCIVKIGFTLSELFSRFNIKGLGAASCTKVYKLLKEYDFFLKKGGKKGIFVTNSYIETLAVDLNDYPISLKGLVLGIDFYTSCVSVLKERLTFSELIGKLGIASLGSKSSDLFFGLDSFHAVREAILAAGSIQNFCNKRGVFANMVCFHIAQSLEDILIASKIFSESLRKEGLRFLDICITGGVTFDGKSITKKQFIKLCNEQCVDSNGVQVYDVRVSEAKHSNPFIIYSARDNTEKYRVGLMRGVTKDNFGEHIVLVTADEFYSFLKGVMNGWESLGNSMT